MTEVRSRTRRPLRRGIMGARWLRETAHSPNMPRVAAAMTENARRPGNLASAHKWIARGRASPGRTIGRAIPAVSARGHRIDDRDHLGHLVGRKSADACMFPD